MKIQQYLFFIIVFVLTAFAPMGAFALTVDITATVPGCGDEIIESGEDCDGSDLGGASCLSRGFSGGFLSCTSACTFNTSQCTTGSFGGGSGSIGNGWIFSNLNSTIVNQNGIITSGIPFQIKNFGKIITTASKETNTPTEEIVKKDNPPLFDVTIAPVQSKEPNKIFNAISAAAGVSLAVLVLFIVIRLLLLWL